MFKKHGELKPEHLQSISIGQKDFQKGLFFIWKTIFQLPKPSRKHFGFLQHLKQDGAGQNTLALSGVQNEFGPSRVQTSNSLRFHNILHLASSNSEFEKMTQGFYSSLFTLSVQNYYCLFTGRERFRNVGALISAIRFTKLFASAITALGFFDKFKDF